MAVQERPRGLTAVKRRVWLVVLLLYAAGAIADAGYRLTAPPPPRGSLIAALPVAICAGLFWPIDIVARRLL